MTITIHQESQSSKETENGVEEIPADNMSLHSETKGEDIEVQKEEIIVAPEPSEIDQEKEPLPLPSLHKVTNPYRSTIPPTCLPQQPIDDKPLK